MENIASIVWIILYIVVGLTVLLIIGGKVYILRLTMNSKRLLRQYQSYSGAPASDGRLPAFSYSEASAPELTALREKYSLDFIAAGKSEIERIVALMKWVNGLSRHAINPKYVPPFNAAGLIQNYAEKKIAMNCHMHAIILNEVYLAQGFKSRTVRLDSYKTNGNWCHWVVTVYSKEAGKWIMMDADMNSYLRDEHGNYLGLEEIRDRITNGEKLVLNKDGGVVGVWRLLGSYTDFLSIYIFRFTCSQLSEYGQEERRAGSIFWELVPADYEPPGLEPIEISKVNGSLTKRISDPSAFWRTP